STQYRFKLQAFCPDNTPGAITSAKNIFTLSCSLPADVTVSDVTNVSATINWTASCSAPLTLVRYRVIGTSLWSTVNTTSSSVNLSGLIASTTYEYQVNKCGMSSGSSLWTPILTFTTSGETTPRPNIIMIVLDDARFDEYSCNGAPFYFQSPNIDR